jgi:hypothetical protein
MSSSETNLYHPLRDREKFAAPIKCRCGQVGSSIWEEKACERPHWSKSMLVGVSNGFYTRIQSKNFDRTEIVCAVCDSVVPD